MKDWLAKWGLWILLVLVFGLYLLSKLLPTSRESRPGSLFLRAKEGARRIKEDTARRLERLAEEMRSRREELEEIKKIEDEAERRRRLAELANRKERL